MEKKITSIDKQGAVMSTECVLTKFLKKSTKMDKENATVLVNSDTQTFSISAKASKVMLTVSLEDAMELISKALEEMKGDENTEESSGE